MRVSRFKTELCPLFPKGGKKKEYKRHDVFNAVLLTQGRN